jgi:ATP-dependent DNA helicase RecG
MFEISGPEAVALVNNLLAQSESSCYESKRVSGKMVGKALETLCAYANTSGGTLALGLEDPLKAMGRDRLFGIGENPEAMDELHCQNAQGMGG